MISQFGAESFWKNSLPAHGIDETRTEFADIFRLYRSKFNLFIASNGTKLQLIGTYLAVRDYLEVQMTYACPAVYNWQYYSEGCQELWEIELPAPEVGSTLSPTTLPLRD